MILEQMRKGHQVPRREVINVEKRIPWIVCESRTVPVLFVVRRSFSFLLYLGPFKLDLPDPRSRRLISAVKLLSPQQKSKLTRVLDHSDLY